MRFLPSAALLALLMVVPGVAHAQLTFTLSSPVQSAAPGASLIFTGTLTNTGPDELFLNSLSVNLFGNSVFYLSSNDSVFLNNVPLSLPAGGAAYIGAILGIDVSLATPDGSYFGQAILQGGPGASDANDLASQPFQVIVNSTPVAPEPGTLGLLLLGLPVFARRVRRGKF